MIGARSTKGLVCRGCGPLPPTQSWGTTEIGRHTSIRKEGAPGKKTSTGGRETPEVVTASEVCVPMNPRKNDSKLHSSHPS